MRFYGRLMGFALCMLMTAVPAAAAPVSASTTVTVRASVLKPLTLTAKGDLDFGMIVLANGTWSGATVSVSQAGVRTCSNANTTCSGTVTAARYNVAGTNKVAIQVTAPNVTLVNQSDSSKTIPLTLSAPTTITLPNSGNQGTDFTVGGSMTLSSTTAGGTYAGTMNVTVDYQ